MKENYFIKNKLKKIAINKFLQKELKSAGFIDSELSKTPLSTRITIFALKPGFVIGKKGSNIRALTEKMEQKFELNKVHLEIGEIANKNLDPKVVIENISRDIARGISWKRAVYRALNDIQRAGAIGAEIVAKGNTTGKGQRKRKTRYAFGYLKKAGDQKNQVGFEKRTTFPGLGTIGIRLRIVQPDTVFSDKIDVLSLAKQYKIKQEEEIIEEREKEHKQEEEKIEHKKKTEKEELSKETEETKTVKKKPVKKEVSEKKTKTVKKEEKEEPSEKTKTVKEKSSKETKETPKETKERPKETKETPKETKETPKETKETPKETKETPKETKETPKETKEKDIIKEKPKNKEETK